MSKVIFELCHPVLTVWLNGQHETTVENRHWWSFPEREMSILFYFENVYILRDQEMVT